MEGRASKKTRPKSVLRDVVVRLAGDSGDGIQVAGHKVAETAILHGNDVRTYPDFPAEIRAPAGSLAGVSGFQVRMGEQNIHTPGDEVDCLVAMNPAALRTNVSLLRRNGILIVNSHLFRAGELASAGYASNPLEDESLGAYRLYALDLSDLTRKALRSLNLRHRDADRCKNFFALGMVFWLYNRSPDHTLGFLRERFGHSKELLEANTTALKAGIAFCEASELFQGTYEVQSMSYEPGKYRNASGNTALAMGLTAAAAKAGLDLFYASYPITPASDLLHILAGYKRYGVKTFQAEDEIASACAALGASYAGSIGVTGSSGPGIALKQETINLAVMTELPLVVVDVQRAGPSTGMPTKTEQSDLLFCLFGRHGDSPVPVLAARSPSDCFEVAVEAVRVALEVMGPVFLLSEASLANGLEPWRIPEVDLLPEIPTRKRRDLNGGFLPYEREPRTMARSWVVPGVPFGEHRIGGLEKANKTGHVSYDQDNHHEMTRLRLAKVLRLSERLPEPVLHGEERGEVLVVGWGGTYGSLRTAVEGLQSRGSKVSWVHLRFLNPLPPSLRRLASNFRTILVPEINTGQLSILLGAFLGRSVQGLNLVRGEPLKVAAVQDAIEGLL